MPTISSEAHSEDVLVTGKIGLDTAPDLRERTPGQALTETGMDLVSLARHFRYALAQHATCTRRSPSGRRNEWTSAGALAGRGHQSTTMRHPLASDRGRTC